MLRSTMGVTAAVCAALALPAASVANTVGPIVRVRVTPTTVHPGDPVTISFRQPSPSGLLADQRRVEAVRVTGPTRRGCIAGGGAPLAVAPANTMVHRTLRPGHMAGRRWCLGRYRGQVTVSEFPRCDPGPVRACPMYVVAPRTIATFTFRVTAG